MVSKRIINFFHHEGHEELEGIVVLTLPDSLYASIIHKLSYQNELLETKRQGWIEICVLHGNKENY
jgi:hypothetical protein